MSARPTLRDAVLAAFPDSWLDPLLTGPAAVVKIPAGCPEIAELLQSVRRRVEEVFEQYAAQPMTFERAHQVFSEIDEFMREEVGSIFLDGRFTTEQLEALVVMRRAAEQHNKGVPGG